MIRWTLKCGGKEYHKLLTFEAFDKILVILSKAPVLAEASSFEFVN